MANLKIRVCVIGAGTAGLSAIKNSLQHNLEVVCYEKNKEIGGTWIYEDIPPEINANTDCDEDIHSSMYRGLRTNLPKEVMGFPDFQYSNTIPESFVTQEDVLEFLQSYASYYELEKHIKFQHEVIRVRPRPSYQGEWEVYVFDQLNNEYKIEYFDRIFVCNGHYTKPQYPTIEGMHLYQGTQMHSHLYRSPEMFKDSNVLIIGAGPSGMDLACHISKWGKRVFLSHHLNPAPDTDFMGTATQKTDVKRFTESGAIFMDDTEEEFSYVIYCTGYQYSFPFLSTDCGIFVKNNHVQPLYKQCINIECPTMAIIGLPFLVLPTQCFDLQIRYILKYFSNQKQLPPKSEMLSLLQAELSQKIESGCSERDAHKMGEKQFAYYKDLSETAGIENIKPVVANIMKACSKKYIYELETYRQYIFKIIDDENFEKHNYTFFKK